MSLGLRKYIPSNLYLLCDMAGQFIALCVPLILLLLRREKATPLPGSDPTIRDSVPYLCKGFCFFVSMNGPAPHRRISGDIQACFVKPPSQDVLCALSLVEVYLNEAHTYAFLPRPPGGSPLSMFLGTVFDDSFVLIVFPRVAEINRPQAVAQSPCERLSINGRSQVSRVRDQALRSPWHMLFHLGFERQRNK
ncbi:hypothetical protein J6590_095301 [Homalodisca vitripennis]|nr:hypothetical protein J6590_095301 [Homalodisca vitripennis]